MILRALISSEHITNVRTFRPQEENRATRPENNLVAIRRMRRRFLLK